MKPIGESAEVFEAYARIDYCYYALREINKTSFKPVAPIVAAVYSACGYNRTLVDAKNIVPLLEEIIRSKKIVEADYSGDEKALNEINEQIKLMSNDTTTRKRPSGTGKGN